MSHQIPRLLGMFARHWQPGKVLPCLARTLGESHAAMVHAMFVCALVDRLQGVADRRLVAFEPAAAEKAFACLVKGRWELTAQPGGSLGERLQQLLAAGLAAGQRVVLITSDVPDLPASLIDQAFVALESHDVVLGPTTADGCYLIGAARRLPPIFQANDASTSQTWQSLVQALAAAGIDWHELPARQDVADEAGLHALAKRLAASNGSDFRLGQLRQELLTLLGPELRRTAKSMQ